jgi:hypothetical protein
MDYVCNLVSLRILDREASDISCIKRYSTYQFAVDTRPPCSTRTRYSIVAVVWSAMLGYVEYGNVYRGWVAYADRCAHHRHVDGGRQSTSVHVRYYAHVCALYPLYFTADTHPPD